MDFALDECSIGRVFASLYIVQYTIDSATKRRILPRRPERSLRLSEKDSAFSALSAVILWFLQRSRYLDSKRSQICAHCFILVCAEHIIEHAKIDGR